MSCFVNRHGEIISQEKITSVKGRYEAVTCAINREFWDLASDSQHSLLVGSYGRGTAIDTSDIDVLVELPRDEYERHNTLKGNGQSRLLQAVRGALQSTYPRSDIRADGQVVKIAFSDGVKFEVLPAFRNTGYYGQSDTYVYPDTNMDGNWRSTNPQAEQDAMRAKNSSSNGLLYDTCKHFRRVRDEHFSSYHLSGIVVDSFVYAAMDGWIWLQTGETSSSPRGTYEKVLSKYLFEHSSGLFPLSLTAPGSNQSVDTESCMECLRKVVSFIAD